jgi:hypothetical protein
MRRGIFVCLFLLAAAWHISAQTKEVAQVEFGMQGMALRVMYRITPLDLQRYWLDKESSRKPDASVVKMTTAQWKESRFVIDSVPALLFTAGATTNSWGCLHCHDQPSIRIEISFKDKSQEMVYNIDSDTSRIPESIRQYVGNVYALVNRLLQNDRKIKK